MRRSSRRGTRRCTRCLWHGSTGPAYLWLAKDAGNEAVSGAREPNGRGAVPLLAGDAVYERGSCLDVGYELVAAVALAVDVEVGFVAGGVGGVVFRLACDDGGAARPDRRSVPLGEHKAVAVPMGAGVDGEIASSGR